MGKVIIKKGERKIRVDDRVFKMFPGLFGVRLRKSSLLLECNKLHFFVSAGIDSIDFIECEFLYDLGFEMEKSSTSLSFYNCSFLSSFSELVLYQGEVQIHNHNSNCVLPKKIHATKLKKATILDEGFKDIGIGSYYSIHAEQIFVHTNIVHSNFFFSGKVVVLDNSLLKDGINFVIDTEKLSLLDTKILSHNISCKYQQLEWNQSIMEAKEIKCNSVCYTNRFISDKNLNDRYEASIIQLLSILKGYSKRVELLNQEEKDLIHHFIELDKIEEREIFEKRMKELVQREDTISQELENRKIKNVGKLVKKR